MIDSDPAEAGRPALREWSIGRTHWRWARGGLFLPVTDPTERRRETMIDSDAAERTTHDTR